MSGKLHLICMKTKGKITSNLHENQRFSCKLDVIFPTFHTSVKRRKITFNSYNYNFSFIHSYSVFMIMFSFKKYVSS